MYLKPKSTVKDLRAMLYRRFTSLEDSFSKKVVYRTEDQKYWLFDAQKNSFIETEMTEATSTVIDVHTGTSFFYFNQTVRYYTGSEWDVATSAITGELLSATYANVAKYQTNKYYFAGSFDFMIKGSASHSTIQYTKGLIAPQKTMNIRTFNDTPEVRPDDLVVINGSLYSVENPEVVYKRMPKKFSVYFMTLNNIL